MQQELLTLPEHPSTPLVFRGVRVASIFRFMCNVCRSLFVFLSDLCLPLTRLVTSTFVSTHVFTPHFNTTTMITSILSLVLEGAVVPVEW